MCRRRRNGPLKFHCVVSWQLLAVFKVCIVARWKSLSRHLNLNLNFDPHLFNSKPILFVAAAEVAEAAEEEERILSLIYLWPLKQLLENSRQLPTMSLMVACRLLLMNNERKKTMPRPALTLPCPLVCSEAFPFAFLALPNTMRPVL